MKGNTIEAFFALLRAGLWEQDCQLERYEPIDFQAVFKLAEEQSVMGLLAAGLEKVTDIKPNKEDLLQFVGRTLQIEQRNRAMNRFIAKLIEDLRRENIYTLLVKGQGIAQCYERPLWRISGDVDLFLNLDCYQRAKQFLSSCASDYDVEDRYSLHQVYHIDNWEVELHGTLRSQLGKRIDRVIDAVQFDTFYHGKVRIWDNEGTDVFLPAPDNDVIFVFTHILQHFFKEGIGLRQICDLCRLVSKYYSQINIPLLEIRLKKMGMFSEWKTLATIYYEYLGARKEEIPFYDKSDCYKKKAKRFMSFVISSGNFGHNRDNGYYSKYPFLVYKMISLGRHLKDFKKHFLIFPVDSIKMLFVNIKNGIVSVAREKFTKSQKKVDFLIQPSS